MKVAYIILCHKNPAQVDALIDSLYTPDTHFYIHVDKKTRSFELRQREGVFFLDDALRVDIQWGTMGMIHATIHAIETVLGSTTAYDYVTLLSGQDFPIKSKDAIAAFLEAGRDINYIEVLEKGSPMHRRYEKRTQLYYPKSIQKATTVCKILRKLYIYISGGYGGTLKLFRRKNVTGLPVAYGSQWWTLTYDCLAWMQAYWKQHPEYVRFFENTMVPDECFFQTLFMASPFHHKRGDKLTYLEWSENQNNPRLFTLADIEDLLGRTELFARKFDIGADSRILTELAKRLEQR